MDDEMFADWSDTGLAIRDALIPYLLRGGAKLEKKNIPRNVRVKVPGATVELLAQLTDQPRKRSVLVKLTVGQKSGLIRKGGPLEPSASGANQAELDRGLIAVTLDDLPGQMPEYTDKAFRHCTGVVPATQQTATRSRAASATVAASEGDDLSDDGADHRETVSRQIKRRRGQQAFRDKLRKRFRERCAVTGSAVLDVLEAAHIKPYRAGERDNEPDNGLLLRADIHTLFDLDQIGVHPETLKIELHPDLARSPDYGPLFGQVLHCPGGRPRQQALRQRYDQFRRACGG